MNSTYSFASIVLHIYWRFCKVQFWSVNFLLSNYLILNLESFFISAVVGENSWYCYSLGGGIGVKQKLWQFVIYMLLLKIFTWNLEYVFPIQRAGHTVNGDNPNCIFSELCPFLDSNFLILSSTPHLSNCTCMWCSLYPHKQSLGGVYWSHPVLRSLHHEILLWA